MLQATEMWKEKHCWQLCDETVNTDDYPISGNKA
jgi:hypothetical protein